MKRKRVLAGRYELESELGSGSMGTVFRARDRRTSRVVAIKLLHPFLRNDPAYVERFRREAAIALALDSRHAIQTLGTGQDDREHFIVMEYVEGEALSSVLRRTGPVSESTALKIAAQVVRALEEASSKLITHRDIKPDNILVQSNGNIKVADFGIAKREGSDASLTVDQLGSIQYTAPERFISSDEVNDRSSLGDIYSLGVVLYEMLAGETPYAGLSGTQVIRRHMEPGAGDPELTKPGLSEEVCRLVTSCLSRDPAMRPQSAEELRQRIDLLIPDTQIIDGIDLPAPIRGRRLARHLPFSKIALVGAAVAVVVTGVLIAVAWPFGRDSAPDPPAKQVEIPAFTSTALAYYDFQSDSSRVFAVSADAGYADGAFFMELPAARRQTTLYLPQLAKDLRIAADIQLHEGSDNSYAGLLCRRQGQANASYYRFFVEFGTTKVGIDKLVDANRVLLASGIASELPATGKAARFEFICIGRDLIGKVNGQVVVSTSDDTYTEGSPGVLVGTYAEGLTGEVRFDNISLSALTVPNAASAKPLSLVFDRRLEAGSIPGNIPPTYIPYQFTGAGGDFESTFSHDMGVKVTPATTPWADDPTFGRGDGGSFPSGVWYLWVPPSTAAGRYTVSVLLPNGQRASADFDHVR